MAPRDSDNGGPAFPRPIGWNGLPHHDEHECSYEQVGMSLRDYFAGQALAGGADSFCDAMGPNEPPTTEDEIAQHAARHARAAYLLADAMLAERAKV